MPLTNNEYNTNNPLHFSAKLAKITLEDDKIPVSYDVSSLFTDVPLEETMN